MKFTFFTFIIALLAISSSVQAQSNSASVDSLNDHLFQSSNRYVESGITYRVMKWTVLSAYFDDIKALDEEKSEQIQASAAAIEALENEKKAQHEAYDKLNAKYDRAIKENDAMAFFSLLIPKNQYNLMMWTLVGLLIGGIVVLYLMFSRGYQTTRLVKRELGDKNEEFDSYRKRTLKREQEVASGYLREIKKLKEQLGRS